MMEIVGLLADGFAVAFQPLNLGLVLIGCTIGLFIGAMPGLGSVNGVAILLPLTAVRSTDRVAGRETYFESG